MAFVDKPQFTATYTFRDNDGKQSTTQVGLPNGLSPAVGYAFAIALRPLLQAISDAALIAFNFTVGQYEDAVPVIARSDVEDKGVFIFNTGNGLEVTLAVPSISEAVLQTDNEDIDLANAAVLAFINAVSLGIGTPLVQPVNASGADIVGVKAAYKQNRKSLLGGRATRKG